jgi:hypothetical protein
LGTVDETNGLFYCGRCWEGFLEQQSNNEPFGEPLSEA